MKKWTSIEQYRHTVKTVQLYFERTGQPQNVPTLDFTGTVKLHGTNAGLRRKNGKFQPQSKEQILSVTCDNMGFAKFIDNIPDDILHKMFDLVSLNPDDDITIYGEWCGPGIQKGTAINKLPSKQWVLFGIWVNDEYRTFNGLHLYIPPVLNVNVLELHNIYSITEVKEYKIVVDFNNPEEAIEKLEQYTKEVEDQCPWGTKFGIEGIGEGIVWVCDQRPEDSSLYFKTKGQKHKTNKSKKVATVDVEKVNGINECVEYVLPERRLEQGLEWMEENRFEITMPNMGKYLQWVGQDVKKEESDTIKENGLKWKEVVKYITIKAKDFYIKKYNEF